jgi:hypothetical protein
MMRKTFLLVGGLLFSVSAQAQILDVIKSTVKDQTGIDLNNPKVPAQTSGTATTQKQLQPHLQSISEVLLQLKFLQD